jgi:NADPH:quinone reductase-like Zn-dependent oxidoreductase
MVEVSPGYVANSIRRISLLIEFATYPGASKKILAPRSRPAVAKAPPKPVLTAYVDAKSIRPVIHSIYNLDNIAETHLSLEREGGRGKRVVKHTDS